MNLGQHHKFYFLCKRCIFKKNNIFAHQTLKIHIFFSKIYLENNKLLIIFAKIKKR